MKTKLMNFVVAMGIPVSAISTQGAGCTGICGSCNLSCTPGVIALVILAAKVVYKKTKGRVLAHE